MDRSGWKPIGVCLLIALLPAIQVSSEADEHDKLLQPHSFRGASSRDVRAWMRRLGLLLAKACSTWKAQSSCKAYSLDALGTGRPANLHVRERLQGEAHVRTEQAAHDA